MTRERAIEVIELVKHCIFECDGDRECKTCEYDRTPEEEFEAFNLAVEVLKQKDIIMDIKAELNEISEETISRADIDAIERCLKIIDKHIGGKEQK